MANIRYEFVPKASIEILQFLRRFKREDAFASYDQEDWGKNAANQLAILGVGRRKNVKSIYPGLQPRIGDKFDDLRRTMRMPKP